MSVETLRDKWRRSGINPGDSVLLHSNIGRTVIDHSRQLGYQVKPEHVLDSFLETLGPAGTLILPLFNFDFTKGTPFDIHNTPSQMGILTEIARTRKGAVRTGHPVYSFVAIGANAHLFIGLNNRSAYSEDSPFGLLKTINGKIAILDLPDSQSMTFYHHIEEINKVDYRYFKSFTGKYTDHNGTTTDQTYLIFVRDLERGVVSHADPAEELLWNQGLYTGYRPHDDTGLRVINALEMFEFITSLIKSNQARHYLYDIKKESI